MKRSGRKMKRRKNEEENEVFFLDQMSSLLQPYSYIYFVCWMIDHTEVWGRVFHTARYSTDHA